MYQGQTHPCIRSCVLSRYFVSRVFQLRTVGIRWFSVDFSCISRDLCDYWFYGDMKYFFDISQVYVENHISMARG
jgi:hypothetical protein